MDVSEIAKAVCDELERRHAVRLKARAQESTRYWEALLKNESEKRAAASEQAQKQE